MEVRESNKEEFVIPTRKNKNGDWKRAHEIEKKIMPKVRAYQAALKQSTELYLEIKGLPADLVAALPETDTMLSDSPFGIERIRYASDSYLKSIGMDGLKGFFPQKPQTFVEYMETGMKWAFKFEKKDEQDN